MNVYYYLYYYYYYLCLFCVNIPGVFPQVFVIFTVTII